MATAPVHGLHSLGPVRLDSRAAWIDAIRRDTGRQAFWLMRIGFTILPLLMGIDKFFNALTYWPKYLAPWIGHLQPGSAQDFMYFVGGVEIFAAFVVLLKPRYGANLVALWLFGIVVNALSYSGWYDIMARDVGLMLAALTLGRLATRYDPPLDFGALRLRLSRLWLSRS